MESNFNKVREIRKPFRNMVSMKNPIQGGIVKAAVMFILLSSAVSMGYAQNSDNEALVNNLWIMSSSKNSLAVSTTYLKFLNDGYVMEISRTEFDSVNVIRGANIGYKWEIVEKFSSPPFKGIYEVIMKNENTVTVRDNHLNETKLKPETDQKRINEYNSSAYNFSPMQLLPVRERTLQGSGARPLNSNIAVSNPNNFSVGIAITTETEVMYSMAAPKSSKSLGVPNGEYDIFFVYSTEPETLYQGDKVTVENQTLKLTLKPVSEGNYGMKKVN
jgi:hypothetical protein